MKLRLVDAFLGACIAAPVQAFELWVFYQTAAAHRSAPLASLIVANAALLALLCSLAADFSLVQRGGKSILLGVGVAVLMPGSVILDQVIASSSPDWDLTTWLLVLLPYAMLLLALSAAETALYLVATRPRVE